MSATKFPIEIKAYPAGVTGPNKIDFDPNRKRIIIDNKEFKVDFTKEILGFSTSVAELMNVTMVGDSMNLALKTREKVRLV